MNNDYDMDETDGRSYISAVSEIVMDLEELCEGHAKNTMGEARMASRLRVSACNTHSPVLYLVYRSSLLPE